MPGWQAGSPLGRGDFSIYQISRFSIPGHQHSFLVIFSWNIVFIQSPAFRMQTPIQVHPLLP